MTPFLVIPWDKPFLPELQRLIVAYTDGRPGEAVVVVPHNRPRRYLDNLFKKDTSLPRPVLLPRLLTIQECIALCCPRETVEHTANVLDRVALLYRCVQDLATRDNTLCARFAAMDLAAFFPWGLRLANVLEECFTQLAESPDLPYVDGEVSRLAADLLGALGRIRAAYVTLLEQRRWTTPGLDAWRAARSDAPLPPQCAPRPPIQVFLAGFSVLTEAENVLLRRLWEAGAHVCLHSDAAVASPATRRTCHWACDDHAHWIASWGASCELITPPSGKEPRNHFVAGYDIHSQLTALGALLDRDGKNPPSTTVVLPRAGLLLPTLHQLSRRECNVSMGYPLERSPLCRLLETVLQLRETLQEDGRYHWRALLRCLRHPYVRMLTPEQAADPARSWRALLRGLEDAIRQGGRFVAPQSLWEGLALPPPLAGLLRQVLEALLDNFAAARTPEGMAEALSRLCALLLERGGSIWSAFPLDAESLYRLLHRIIPTLRDSELAAIPFPVPALHALTRQLIQTERVPFEADPLVGLQVLGMLETRLLHFERVIILDATDDALPGAPAQDPLLPDALRLPLGLPDAHRRERTAAHTLFRLMAGAAEVHLFWQEGVQRSPLFDGRKVRSRFVDALIWQEERRRASLLSPGEPPLATVPCPVRPMPRQRRGLRASEALRRAMRTLLEKPLSPTRLDAWLTCPLRFALDHLCNIRPLEEVQEGDDPAEVGTLLHKTLRQAYEPWLNQILRHGQPTPEVLTATFNTLLREAPLQASLSPDSLIMLELAGSLRLKRYLENQPPDTRVLALEIPLMATLERNARRYRVKGILDRVDQREGGLHVLDYKTGRVVPPTRDLWTDAAFWERLDRWEGEPEEGLALLEETASRLSSVQLPCYLLLCEQSGLGTPHDAAWVRLQEDGKEIVLLGEMDATSRQTVFAQHIPALLGFILQHMETTPEFFPKEGAYCDWCPHLAQCLQ